MPTWIRVKDDVTGHEYDVNERALRPGMTPIPGYPPNSSPGARPRPPKPFVGKDGNPRAFTGGDQPLAEEPTPDHADGEQSTTSSDPAVPADNTKEQ